MTNPHAAAVLFTKDHQALARFYREVAGLQDAGGAADHVKLASGAFVCDGYDPEGNVFQLLEPLRS
jgi:hypothetical protein